MKTYKTIGILGGMGPAATHQLYGEIIENTPADKDQDHIPVVIYSYPQIPDRTEALLHNGENPLPYIFKGLEVLKNASADFVIVPCNTAHKFLNQITDISPLPIISMITETKNYIKKAFPQTQKVGLLATTGTIKTDVYKDELVQIPVEVITPDDTIQENYVMEAIYGNSGIKAGYRTKSIKDKLIKACEHLKEKGAEIIIMGCTEIPLMLNQTDTEIPLVNPMKVIAKKAISFAKTDTTEIKNYNFYHIYE
jgi:aspartate racemase